MKSADKKNYVVTGGIGSLDVKAKKDTFKK